MHTGPAVVDVSVDTQWPAFEDQRAAGRDDPDLVELVSVVPVREDQRDAISGAGELLVPRTRTTAAIVLEAALFVGADRLVTAALDAGPDPRLADADPCARQVRPAERERV